jgi:hypothetical protein
MKKLLVLIIIITSVLWAKGLVEIASFPWLNVTYEGEAKVFNTSCDRLEYNDPFYHAQGDTSAYIKVMEYIPDSQAGDVYSILFYMGEGGISRYEFYLEGECVTPAFVLFADHLHFKGEGLVVAQGSMNEMFNRSRLFRINKGVIKEQKQPFYAVNIASIAKKDFDIYQSKFMNKVIDHVNADDEVYVLLSEFRQNYVYYLLRSKRGLCGWIKIEQGTWVDETPIKDLYYHGD